MPGAENFPAALPHRRCRRRDPAFLPYRPGGLPDAGRRGSGFIEGKIALPSRRIVAGHTRAMGDIKAGNLARQAAGEVAHRARNMPSSPSMIAAGRPA